MNPGMGEMATTTEPMVGQAVPAVDPEQAKRKRMLQMLAMGMMNQGGQGQGLAGGIGQIVQALMMKKLGGM